MVKPAKFDKGKKLSAGQYKYAIQLRIYESRCKHKSLLKRIKAEAKKKFNVYPSAYANAWIRREYKKRGGKYQSRKKIIENSKNKPTLTTPSGQNIVMDGNLFFNTKDSNLYTVKEETNERKIVERRGDAKEGDLWIHPNTGNLKMKVGDKWITVNDPNELPKINNQKRRKDLSAAFAERRKKEQIEEKVIKKVEKAKITRGQFLYKYKSPQNFYSWQDLAREHINCSYRNQQYIYNSPAYYLKDDLCNSLINTNIDNLKLSERPNIVNPSFFLLNSNNINRIKYSFIECHKWSLKGSKLDEEPESFSQIHDVYVNFVIDPDKILYFAFSWKDLKMPKFSEMNKLRKDPYSEEEIRCFEDQFHTVVNLLLLMNQQPDIITEEYIPSKVIPLPKKYKPQSPIKPSAICWVGKDFTRRVIKLKPKMNEEDFVISGNTRKIRPHWRRGHWHTVLKGKNRKERKMRWYQPVFVVGSQAA
jgi:hypothetical protein